MTMRQRCAGILVGLLLLVMLPAFLGGCASDLNTGGGPDRTSGLAFTMDVERGVNSIVRYKVHRTGRVAFSGGADARAGTWSWSGMMSDDEIRTLNELVEKHRWDLEPLNRSNADDRKVISYRLQLRTSKIRTRYRHDGESPRLAPVREFLERATARRNDEYIRQLPEPSMRDQFKTDQKARDEEPARTGGDS